MFFFKREFCFSSKHVAIIAIESSPASQALQWVPTNRPALEVLYLATDEVQTAEAFRKAPARFVWLLFGAAVLNMSSNQRGPSGSLGYSFIGNLRSHEIRISIYPTCLTIQRSYPLTWKYTDTQQGFNGMSRLRVLITAQMEKFWIRFKTLQKRKDEAPTYRMVNGILIIWKVIGSKRIS